MKRICVEAILVFSYTNSGFRGVILLDKRGQMQLSLPTLQTKHEKKAGSAFRFTERCSLRATTVINKTMNELDSCVTLKLRRQQSLKPHHHARNDPRCHGSS